LLLVNSFGTEISTESLPGGVWMLLSLEPIFVEIGSSDTVKMEAGNKEGTTGTSILKK